MARFGKKGGSTPRLLTVRYLGALAAVAVLAVSSTYLVWADINRQDTESAAIGLATDQVVASYEMEAAIESISSGEPTFDLLSGLVGEAAKDHERLVMGDEAAQTLAESRDGVLSALRSVDSALDSMAITALESDPASLPQLGAQVDLFRLGMEQVLTSYRSSAEARSDTLQQRQILLLGSMLVLLIGEGLFLFRPLTKRLDDDMRAQAELIAASQDKVEYLTDFDRLTGLPNRSHVAGRLQAAVNAARSKGGLVTLMVLNLDDFHTVNDHHGTEAGDQLLIETGRRLTEAARDTDIVGRLGSDDFAIVVEGNHNVADAEDIADKLLATQLLPHLVNGRQLFVTASIGIVVYPLDGDDVEGLFRDAGIALFAAKAAGRNNYQFFTDELRQHTSERLNLIDGLREALQSSEELRLVYQPKIDLVTGDVIGVEALIRWEHPDLGTILPAKFIPIAEETDLIIPLGRWVLDRAVAQASEWVDRGMPVSINVSSREFKHGGLVESVAEALDNWNLDASQLEVELTEGTLIEDVEGAKTTLRRLKEMGINVSIDDFGTGYSSLSYLKRFPIDTLKIDRSFISDITDDPDDAAISRAIVSLARSLRMSVVAEGVETTQQLEFLRELGCDAVQGYLFSRPLTPESLEEFVAQSPPATAALTGS